MPNRTHNRPIDLFVFDLDGTALGGYEPYDRLPDPFSQFLDDLSDRGILWGINSTWSPHLQMPMIARSAVRSRPAFMIGRTGLMIAYVNATLDTITIDAEHHQRVEQACQHFSEHALPTLARWYQTHASDDFHWSTLRDEPLMQYLIATGTTPRSRHGQLREALQHFITQHEHLHAQDHSTQPGWIVTPVLMTKGAALKTMQQKLGIESARTMVAGDEMNDLTMMQPTHGQYCVCPDNAHATIKAHVQRYHGCIGDQPCSDGIILAARQLLSAADG